LGSGSGAGTYGSANEVDIINAMGGGSSSGSLVGTRNNGASGKGNTITGGAGVSKIPAGARGSAAIAQRIAQQYGWASGIQWQDFLRIVNHEDASWSVSATNPQSGAYGIPQALPGSKMSSAGPDWRTNAQTQLKWMYQYIKGRYGTPSNAWQHEMNVGWYGAGGTTQPGLSIVGERGPELRYEGGGSQIFSNSQTMQLINAIRGSNTAQNPWKTDVTSGGNSNVSGQRAAINVTFSQGAIVIHSPSGGQSGTNASRAGREIVREIVKQLNNESVHMAIRNGDKL
jgi:hypothetical protein